MTSSNLRKWLFVPILLAGVAIFGMLVKNRAEPEQSKFAEAVHAVRTITVPSLTVVPRFLGNGNVEPSQTWNGVAQVAGKVTAIDPLFKKGAVVPAGQFLLQIDPSDYELAIREVESNIEATRAQLLEIDIQEANSNASLKIETDSLEISKAEMARKRRLVERGTTSRSDFDSEQRSVLAQQQNVQSLENTIRRYPAERRRLQAELERLQVRLAGARLDRERTRVVAPFTARVASANVELYEFVRVGDRLGAADSIDRAEIEVQVPIWRVAALLQSEGVNDFQLASTLDLGVRFGLSVEVFLEREAMRAKWTGRVARFSDTLDPRTRTVGVIVEVDHPYADVQPGVRPPLLKGLFVGVEVRGRPLPGALVIPRVAMHGKVVYVVDDDERLTKRSIQTGHAGQGFYVVTEGLSEGERIVVSDVIPAIDNMLLKPIDDPEVLDRLTMAATAGGASR